ncbi:MAG: O-antigen ligase family protein [Chloroflexi bacterium]|nr:O-antigen ligase family protein [Chloroflexota bacterium]
MKISLRQYMPSGYMLVVLLGILFSTTILLGFTAAQTPVLALAIVALIPLLLAIVLVPDAPTLVVIALLYSNAAVIAVQFHHMPRSLSTAVPGLLLIPLANYLVIRREKIVVTSALIPILLFHLVQVFSILFTKDVDQAFQNWMDYLLEGLGLYFVITNAVRTQATLQKTIWVLLIVGGLIGGVSTYQLVTETYKNNYWGFAQVSNAAFGTGETTLYGEVLQPRLAGSIGENNRFAQTMLMLVPLGLFFIGGTRSYLLRGLIALLTVGCVLGVAVTFSRGAAVAFVFVLIMMAFMRYIKVAHMGLVLLGIVLFFIALPQYSVRILKFQAVIDAATSQENAVPESKVDSSLQGRANEVVAALLVFSDYPIFGVGPHMFPSYYRDYSKEAGFKSRNADREAHNLYAGLAADNGLVGLTCFLAIFAVTLRDLVLARRRWLQSNPGLALLATGFILALIAYLVTGVGAHFTYIRFFWIIMALANSTVYIAQSQAKASDEQLKQSTNLAQKKGLAMAVPSLG